MRALIPLTRAVHLLVVHVRDPEPPIATLLRDATSALPTVEPLTITGNVTIPFLGPVTSI